MSMIDRKKILDALVVDPNYVEVALPEGHWHAELRKIALRFERKDGTPLVSSKTSEPFGILSMLFAPREPDPDVADVSKKDAELYRKSGDGDLVRYEVFVRDENDRKLKQAGHLLKSLGVATTARTWRQITEQYDGGALARIKVRHDVRDGETYYKAADVTPIQA